MAFLLILLCVIRVILQESLVFLWGSGWDFRPPQAQSNIWNFLHRSILLSVPDLAAVTCCNIPPVQLLWPVIYKTISKCRANAYCLNRNALVTMSSTRGFTFYFFHHLLARNSFQYDVHLQWCLQVCCDILSWKSCKFSCCCSSVKPCLSLPGLIKPSGGETSASSGGSVPSSGG